MSNFIDAVYLVAPRFQEQAHLNIENGKTYVWKNYHHISWVFVAYSTKFLLDAQSLWLSWEERRETNSLTLL